MHNDHFLDPCMSKTMKSEKGWIVLGKERSWLRAIRQGAMRVDRVCGGKTVRSLDPRARRARCEARSRSCPWSNLEPLKES